jgi:hypothetical protein
MMRIKLQQWNTQKMIVMMMRTTKTKMTNKKSPKKTMKIMTVSKRTI